MIPRPEVRHSGGRNEDEEADNSVRGVDGRSQSETEQDVDSDGSKEDIIETWPMSAPDAEVELPERARKTNDADEDDVAQIVAVDTIERDNPDDDLTIEDKASISRNGSVELDSSSIPDDTPSLRGSLASTPAHAVSTTPRSTASPRHSGSLQPFDRRFDARPSASRSGSSRAGSPSFLSPHSRQISISSRPSNVSSDAGLDFTDAPQSPWEVVRWTKLQKITTQAFSEAGKRSFGRPTCLAASALIAVGTSKGLILGFDYHQTLKIIIGQGTKATECGSVTAIAIAADYSTIASGHANGHIFTWEINRPSQPFLRIPPMDREALKQTDHQDGHLSSTAVLHIGFLGTRHTALVSADAAGMAFSHLATRGLGPVTRTIKTARLLGRYPSLEPQTERSRKPSSVLAFSPLPLGNVESRTDQMGLTALLTPYLLVIVSTTPVAQTQWKTPRPKEALSHGTLSGCLAWFPAVKLKRPVSDVGSNISNTKLVYCWSNVLTVLEVRIVPAADGEDANKPPTLEFSPRSRWRAEEAIVAVQWLGRSVLGVLTISQRLLIVEDGTLRVADSVDLLGRHIYHQDLFSQQLQSVVETVNPTDPTLHGVVADAFYMSFRAHKGRTFLLGVHDLTVGTLSNWADRLVALMTIGDYIAAIKLATDYFAGGATNVTVGLPDNDADRHAMVRERLLGMVSASLNYAFAQHDEERVSRLSKLASACFEACMGMRQTEYLFGEIFDMFVDADQEGVFISALEPYIAEGEISVLPPDVVKSLVAHFISEGQAGRVEELLCRLDPHSIDLDQMTMLCRQHGLYDALVYVWTLGIGDFVTPLLDLLTLVKVLSDSAGDEDLAQNPYFDSATKIFPYLAFSLTGRAYPSGEQLDEGLADMAKTELYSFLFAGRPIAWPPGSKSIFHTAANSDVEPPFPYLVLLLRFDTPSLMSVLNEAFEDPYLNRTEEEVGVNGKMTGASTTAPTMSRMTREQILSILLDVVKQEGFQRAESVYLDMFVARSISKYPGQLVLTGSLLDRTLLDLCQPPSEDLIEECQLSVEYLLSAHRPLDEYALIQALKQARFYRVLKTTYRSSKMFTELIQTYFEDPEDKEGVFDCISLCLLPSNGLSQKQLQSVKETIIAHSQALSEIDVLATAAVLSDRSPELLRPCLDLLQDTHAQFLFLRTLLEPELVRNTLYSPQSSAPSEHMRTDFADQYIRLMCSHEPRHVADYISTLDTSDLRLDSVLPAMESNGIIDAEVVLLSRGGLAREAMERLVSHLQGLQQAVVGLLNALEQAPDVQSTLEGARDVTSEIIRYTKVGVWLCQGQAANVQRRLRPVASLVSPIPESELDLDEFLWVNLLDSIVQITRAVSLTVDSSDWHDIGLVNDDFDAGSLKAPLRTNVQQTFTALLATTSSPKTQKGGAREPDVGSASFPRILRAFLTRTARTQSSLADLRAVLSDIFAAYVFEEGILTLANDLLGSDVFADMRVAHDQRQMGWRPRTQVCERCKRRAWGPGVDASVWYEWVAREQARSLEKTRTKLERRGDKGKAKSPVSESRATEAAARQLTLVVFACRHVFHRSCLDGDFSDGRPPVVGGYGCPLCAEHKQQI